MAATTALEQLPPGGDRYDPEGYFDEGFEDVGKPREHYAEILERLAETDLDEAVKTVRRTLLDLGCAFGAGEQREAFRVDVVPRVITPEEWVVLAAGLEQRVQALDAFMHDIHGARAIVKEGLIPERVITGADYWEPELDEFAEPRIRVGMAGLDIVRTPTGQFQVLEDNLRTPSGLAYAFAARRAVLPHAAAPDGAHPAPVDLEDAAIEALGRVLRNAAPGGPDKARVVLLTDGIRNTAHWEHRELAERLDIPLVTLDTLDLDQVDVVYRRTDDDRLNDVNGQRTAVGRALEQHLRDGRVAVINALGNGVADDKLVHAHVEDMVRFYLHEEPLICSVPTFDLAEPDRLTEVLDRIDEMVVKPRSAYGGEGVFVGPTATPQQRDQIAATVRDDPEAWIAQETVFFSRHPTVIDGELAPRHVDLRAFVTFDGERAQAIPGGLSRVAYEEGNLVVNSSQGGGGKDTWVLER
ncbi:MAG TPA: circularly permuted type 2 ATP-grasp protein [Solirubrobacteraceae bacterium]|nr:circularly permuted type 2 ATP-grasp protein [Solirubrobacteraceae bacterium]